LLEGNAPAPLQPVFVGRSAVRPPPGVVEEGRPPLCTVTPPHPLRRSGDGGGMPLGARWLTLSWAWALWETSVVESRAERRCAMLHRALGELQNAANEELVVEDCARRVAGAAAGWRWEIERETLKAEVESLRTKLDEKNARWEVERAAHYAQLGAALGKASSGPWPRTLEPALVRAHQEIGKALRSSTLAHCFMAWAACAQQTQEGAALLGDEDAGQLRKEWSPEICVSVLLRSRLWARPGAELSRRGEEASMRREVESLRANLEDVQASERSASQGAEALRRELDVTEARLEALQSELSAVSAAAARTEGGARARREELEDARRASGDLEPIRKQLAAERRRADEAEARAESAEGELDEARSTRLELETCRREAIAAVTQCNDDLQAVREEAAAAKALARAEGRSGALPRGFCHQHQAHDGVDTLDTPHFGSEGLASHAASPTDSWIDGADRLELGACAGAGASSPSGRGGHHHFSFAQQDLGPSASSLLESWPEDGSEVGSEVGSPGAPEAAEQGLERAAAATQELWAKVEVAHESLLDMLGEVDHQWGCTRRRVSMALARAVNVWCQSSDRLLQGRVLGSWFLYVWKQCLRRREHMRGERKIMEQKSLLKTFQHCVVLGHAGVEPRSGASTPPSGLTSPAMSPGRQSVDSPQIALICTSEVVSVLSPGTTPAFYMSGSAAGSPSASPPGGAFEDFDRTIIVGRMLMGCLEVSVLSPRAIPDLYMSGSAAGSPLASPPGDAFEAFDRTSMPGSVLMGCLEVSLNSSAIAGSTLDLPSRAATPNSGLAASAAPSVAASLAPSGAATPVGAAAVSATATPRTSMSSILPIPWLGDESSLSASGRRRLSRLLAQESEKGPQDETEEQRLQRLLKEGIEAVKPDVLASLQKMRANKYQVEGKAVMVKLVGENMDQVLLRKGSEWLRIPAFFVDQPPAFAPGGGAGRLGFAGPKAAAPGAAKATPPASPRPAAAGGAAGAAPSWKATPPASPKANGSLTPPPASPGPRGSIPAGQAPPSTSPQPRGALTPRDSVTSYGSKAADSKASGAATPPRPGGGYGAVAQAKAGQKASPMAARPKTPGR